MSSQQKQDFLNWTFRVVLLGLVSFFGVHEYARFDKMESDIAMIKERMLSPEDVRKIKEDAEKDLKAHAAQDVWNADMDRRVTDLEATAYLRQ